MSFQYEALNKDGLPYARDARIVSEVPHSVVMEVLKVTSTAALKAIGIETDKPVRFGIPVYQSLGMSKVDVRKHIGSNILLTKGCDLPLSYYW